MRLPKNILVLAFFLAAPAALLATEPPWVELFNGQDFSNWKLVGPTNLASAMVEDGAMVLRQRRKTAEHTFVTSTNKIQ